MEGAVVCALQDETKKVGTENINKEFNGDVLDNRAGQDDDDHIFQSKNCVHK